MKLFLYLLGIKIGRMKPLLGLVKLKNGHSSRG